MFTCLALLYFESVSLKATCVLHISEKVVDKPDITPGAYAKTFQLGWGGVKTLSSGSSDQRPLSEEVLGNYTMELSGLQHSGPSAADYPPGPNTTGS